MMHSTTLYVGLDVHKNMITVAHVLGEPGAEITYVGPIGTRQCDVDKLSRRLQSKAANLVFVYEAGRAGTISKEARPRFGVTLVRVKRRRPPILVSRPRQAPDGHKQGGTQPTDISMINRRSCWPRFLPCLYAAKEVIPLS